MKNCNNDAFKQGRRDSHNGVSRLKNPFKKQAPASEWYRGFDEASLVRSRKPSNVAVKNQSV